MLKHCQEIDPNYNWQGSNPNSAIARAQKSYNSTVAESDRLSIEAELVAPPRQQTFSQAVHHKSRDEFFSSL